jgi:GWxTD domain-containing protein
MGLLAADPPLPFIAAVHFLAGPSPESTMVVFGLSLSANTLGFRNTGPWFEAGYRVEAVFRRAGETLREVMRDELVRVATYAETQRIDESVIFQQSFILTPGEITASITIRDRTRGDRGQTTGSFVVPAFDEVNGVSALIPVHDATPRSARRMHPDLVLNPRAMAVYGRDSLQLYLEGHGRVRDMPIVLRALSTEDGAELWRDTVVLRRPTGAEDLATGVVTLGPETLPVGEFRLLAWATGAAEVRATPALIAVSDQWAVGDFSQLLSLLRYFPSAAELQALRGAGAQGRTDLWRSFWRSTDPDPRTVNHEALDQYLERVRGANTRFAEAGTYGWLTDRGEVYITLGEPDEIVEQRAPAGVQVGWIRWEYRHHSLVLNFFDENDLGEFRLTDESRVAYQHVLQKQRAR